MPQFFVDIEMAPGREVTLRGADARHIGRSLRLAVGDWIVLSDGAGRAFRAIITAITPTSVRATVEQAIERPRGRPAPALALAVIGRERFEWAVQKAVELGVTQILPFHSRRSEPLGSSNVKLERWQRIALEAAKQSGLPTLPQIESPLPFAELCQRFAAFPSCLLLFEGERAHDLRAAAALLRKSETSENDVAENGRSSLVIVGPEGGFAPDEVELACNCGALSTSLGRQILRVETAAVAAIAILQYELGNMGLA